MPTSFPKVEAVILQTMTGKHHFSNWIGILLFIGLLLCPWFSSSTWLRLVELMLIYSIAGLGLQLLSGQAGLISLGQGGFMAIGAYTTAILLNAGFPLWLGILLSICIAALAGILLALPANRLQGPYLAIVTLAFGIGISTWIAHTDWLGASSGLAVMIPSLDWAFIKQESGLYLLVLLFSLTAYLAGLFLQKSQWGLIWQGIRDGEIILAHLGINPSLYKTLAFAICAAFGGLAGALLALYIGYLSPASFGFTLSVSLLAGVVFGGLYKLQGAILGVCLLTLLEQNLLPSGLSSLGWMLEGAIMIVVILAFPKGIWHKIQTIWS